MVLVDRPFAERTLGCQGFLVSVVQCPTLEGWDVDSASIVGCYDWYSWPEPALEKAPRSPAVYVFRIKGSTCGRLLGSSDIVYIGTTKKQGLSGRLRDHANQKDGRHWLRRIPNEVAKLEVAWLTLETHAAARTKESDLLAQYSQEHIELPPGNRQQSEKGYQDVLDQLPKLPREELEKLSLWVASYLKKSANAVT